MRQRQKLPAWYLVGTKQLCQQVCCGQRCAASGSVYSLMRCRRFHATGRGSSRHATPKTWHAQPLNECRTNTTLCDICCSHRWIFTTRPRHHFSRRPHVDCVAAFGAWSHTHKVQRTPATLSRARNVQRPSGAPNSGDTWRGTTSFTAPPDQVYKWWHNTHFTTGCQLCARAGTNAQKPISLPRRRGHNSKRRRRHRHATTTTRRTTRRGQFQHKRGCKRCVARVCAVVCAVWLQVHVPGGRREL